MEHLAYHAGELGKAVMWNLGMGGDDATARNGEFALSPEHYAYEGYQAQKAEQSAAFLAGQEEVPGLLGAFNHTCLIPLNRSLVAGNGTLTWYDEQLDGPLGYGACADSSILSAVIILLVVLIATSSRSGGGVASRGFQYAGYNKATLPTAPKPTKKELQQLKERARGAALV